MNPILFIADTHILSDGEDFFRLLEKIVSSRYDVVFLGDVFELWLGIPFYETPLHRKFLDWCAAERTRRKLYFLVGNHEFYLLNRRKYFTRLSRRGIFLDEGRLYCVHGDTVNRKDWLYLLFRMAVRNPLAWLLALLAGPFFGRCVTEKIRLSMKGGNQVNKKYFPAAELEKLSGKLRKTGVRTAVCGHFHRKGEAGIFHALPNHTLLGIYTPGESLFRYVEEKDLFS